MNSEVIVIMYLYSASSTNGIQQAFGFSSLAAREWEAPDPALHSDRGWSLLTKLYRVGAG